MTQTKKKAIPTVIIDAVPNVEYELDDENANRNKINSWKHLVSDFDTPFRKFFVIVAPEVRENVAPEEPPLYSERDHEEDERVIDEATEALVQFLDKKYKALGWKYSQLTLKVKRSTSWEFLAHNKVYKVYVEILDLPRYYRNSIDRG